MDAYSLDLRERVLADCDAGQSNDEVARKYRVSASWIRRLKQRRRETGSIAPKKRRVPPPQWTAYTDEISRAVDERPDTTLKELRATLGLKLSEPTLCRALQELRLSWKKKGSPRGGTRSAGRRGSTRPVASGNVGTPARTLRVHR